MEHLEFQELQFGSSTTYSLVTLGKFLSLSKPELCSPPATHLQIGVFLYALIRQKGLCEAQKEKLMWKHLSIIKKFTRNYIKWISCWWGSFDDLCLSSTNHSTIDWSWHDHYPSSPWADLPLPKSSTEYEWRSKFVFSLFLTDLLIIRILELFSKVSTGREIIFISV